MRYMNEHDIESALDRYADHGILGPAALTLNNLMHWTNRNSDGWCYWQKPVRAAVKLMELIERDGTNKYYADRVRADVTVEEYKRALQPIKSFRTRHNADFVIVEAAR